MSHLKMNLFLINFVAVTGEAVQYMPVVVFVFVCFRLGTVVF